MTYIVIYSHRHGINTGLVECARNPSETEIMTAYPDWEFELDREDEFIELVPIDDNEPILIP